MKSVTGKRIFHALLCVFLLFLDQITKVWARSSLQGAGTKVVIPGLLSFLYLENTGAVWGIFRGKTVFLLITAILILAAVLFFYFKVPMEKHYLPIRLVFVFITAGALGNIIDRILFGCVTDFIQFEFMDFPVFNVADIYITVSTFCIAVLLLFFYKDEPEREKNKD